MPRVRGVFEQLPGICQALELLLREEVVVDAVLLTGPGRPGGGRHGQLQLGDLLEQPADQGSLADTGRAGDDEQATGRQGVGVRRLRYLRKWLTSSARWRWDRPPIVLLGEMRH